MSNCRILVKSRVMSIKCLTHIVLAGHILSVIVINMMDMKGINVVKPFSF